MYTSQAVKYWSTSKLSTQPCITHYTRKTFLVSPQMFILYWLLVHMQGIWLGDMVHMQDFWLGDMVQKFHALFVFFFPYRVNMIISF